MSIPNEFVGQARAFIREVDDDFAREGKRLTRLVRPLADRLIKFPRRKTRDGVFDVFAKAWRDLPATYRLLYVAQIDPRGRKGYIVEARVAPLVMSDPLWADDVWQLGVSLRATTIDVPIRHSDVINETVMASVSLHALARRYQRGVDTSREAILEDMRALVAACPRLITATVPGEAVDVPCPSGMWHGHVRMVATPGKPDAAIVVVRTFLDHDA